MALDIISSAFQTGLISDDEAQEPRWASVRPRVASMLQKVDNRTTLFLGAAVSTFKPTALPTWEKFIELIYTSLIDEATADIGTDSQEVNRALKTCIADALHIDSTIGQRVPNYKVTEVIARRLGKDYLRLLKAFETEKLESKWLVNHAHKWAAECLIFGKAAAVVTTNFDDCIEKALLNAEANVYTLTGDPYIDGDEIVNHMVSDSGRLIVVVSGPEACIFAQTLLPQLGGTISFLFKLHGSCYVPESCIDTRLQRQQGLPSYAVDILDNLLVRSVFFVVGFSGGDLNDNTDYLRMVHNKREARLVWLQKDLNDVESGVRNLDASLQTETDTTHGLCFLRGVMPGEQVKWSEEPSAFKRAVEHWANGLGMPWCKLVVLDLIELCNGTASLTSELEKLGFRGTKRQDWNSVVEEELLGAADQEQLQTAKQCKKTAEFINSVFTDSLDEAQRISFRDEAEDQRLKMRELHLDGMKKLNTHRPHAQSWVISALYGLLLFSGGQQRAAFEALSFAQNAAYLVGDLESSNATKKLIDILDKSSRFTMPESPTMERGDVGSNASVVSIIPSLDNVSAKANQYGVPPEMFLRALLHRAILFSDNIAIPPNVITNSSIFINQLLFGGIDELRTFYLDFLHPFMPHNASDEQDNAFLTNYFRSRVANTSYIREAVAERHMHDLDAYFEAAGVHNKYIFFSAADIAGNYKTWVLRAVTELKDVTKLHFIDKWRFLRPHGLKVLEISAEREAHDTQLAADMADTIINVVSLFVQNLAGPLDRSKLYHLSGLFATIIGDDDAIHRHLRADTPADIKESLVAGRKTLLERPWISGPLCRELFDVPYRANIPVHLIMTSSSPRSLVFLEEHEVSSWRYMVDLLGESANLRVNYVSVGEEAENAAQISALLLSQASEHDLVDARRRLAPIRRKLAANEALDDAARELLAGELKSFAGAAVDVEDEPIAEISAPNPDVAGDVREYVQQCVFLVRKSEAMDRMYEEPQFALPGVMTLERTT